MTALNNEYWAKIPSEQIMTRKIVPGDELLTQLPPGAEILDLGCGNGHISKYLFEKGYRVSAIDINNDAIRLNKERYPNIHFVCSDIKKELPFQNGTFDAITISFVLTSFIDEKERNSLLNEIERVLKPGGFVWLREPLVSPDYALRYEISKPILSKEYSFFVYSEKNLSHAVTTTAELQKTIENKQTDRIAHHYTENELDSVFNSFQKVFSAIYKDASPHSGTILILLTAVYKKR